jgi:uncharacterized membrane protein YozB (DUF420 family)
MASPPLVATTRTSNERLFFTGMAITMLVVVFAGFARSFYLRSMFPEWHRPAESVFYVHGTVFSAWVILLITQASLVMTGRRDVHRKLGVAGAVLAALMVVLGTVAALVAARRPTGFVDVPVPPLQFLAIPLFALAQFALFAGLAIAWRRDLQAHKRLMLLATIMLCGAAVARLPLVSNWGPLGYFGVTDLLLVPLIVWDLRTRGRLHPVTLWGGLLIIALEPLQLMLSGTEGWIAFARWATGLLG